MKTLRLSVITLMLALLASVGLSTATATTATTVAATTTTTATATATADPGALRAAPPDSDCDVFIPDVTPPSQIYPGETRFNPEIYGAKSQLWQYHSAFEDTYAAITLKGSSAKRIANIYIHDINSDQYCWGVPEEDNGIVRIETGVLNNLNTSVQLCIVAFDGHHECGEPYREDAGGHRQNGREGKKTDGKLDRDPQEDLGYQLAHDYHERPNDRRVHYDHGLVIFHRPTGVTEVEMQFNIWNTFGAEETYAAVESTRADQLVSVQSDKYGQGKWYKGKWNPGKETYQTETGVYYNEHDRLRVCTKQKGEPNKDATCGDWHDGGGV